MKKCNLTTQLNMKLLSIVLVILLFLVVQQHVLAIKEENDEAIQLLIATTSFLSIKKPPGSFTALALSRDPNAQTLSSQVTSIHKELQPILDEIFLPSDIIKFGFYSCEHQRIVAAGPKLTDTLFRDTEIPPLQDTKLTTAQLIKPEHSVFWPDANVICYVKPIEENGIIVGHAIASLNQDAITATVWKRTGTILLGVLFMIVICIFIFYELFVKLKADLQLFAESIVNDEATPLKHRFAEFEPITNYIIEQREKMRKLDRLNIIGEMAAGITHEVRNPMTTVRGLLQFIGHKPEFSKHRENFDLMISEIDRANSIISEFLSLAKNRPMEFKENNLNEIIHDIYPLLQADALRNNCQISATLAVIPPLLVDQNGIRQLILNLVRNGLDAMSGRGGSLIISTRKVNNKVLLSVKDNGSGISPAIQAKLGTPFFTTKEGGTGLGLAICYRIIERHQATLTVDSEPGRGTTFTICFFNPIVPSLQLNS